MESRRLIVPEGLEGSRLDSGLTRLLGLSRTHVASIITDGGVLVDGSHAAKSDRMMAGQLLEVSWEPSVPLTIEPQEVKDLHVVFDDDDIIVVSKPIGVAAHPAVSWNGPTVLGALAAAGYTIASGGPPERKGIVQRLDVGTSGLMAVAKSERAYSVLKQAFRDRAVHKVYHTIVQGHPDPLAGTIDAPIGRHPSADWRFAVVSSGKPSITHYETIEAFPYASLLEVTLESGRTHQIRVHMAAQRHPCIGDTLYGADPTLTNRLKLDRQWLHAVRLGFEHPRTGKYVEFTSEYPDDLAQALTTLRKAANAPREDS